MKTLLILATLVITAAADTPAPQPFGSGTITRDSSGKTAITTRYGLGTMTRISGGSAPSQTWITTPYGKGSVTRTSTGRTLITTPYGSQPASGRKISPLRR
jgi:hypothetical protein